ncbi:phospholipase [Myxococcus sp. AM001]|nr:phospholipase [Myxococcus sp. AM001]
MRSSRSVRWLLVAQSLAVAACTSPEKEAPRPPASAAAPAPGMAAPEPGFPLPRRQGPRPETSDAPPGTPLAHMQLSQQAPTALQEQLFLRASALPGVRVAPSGISVPGARAFWLHPELARGPRAAFQVGTEFAHIHPAHDGSLHMKFPPDMAAQVFQQGWGVPHPRSGTPMVFGPRTAEELEVVWQLLLRAHAWAQTGQVVSLRVE